MKIHTIIISFLLWIGLACSGVLAAFSILILIVSLRSPSSLLYFPGEPPTAEIIFFPTLLGLALIAIVFMVSRFGSALGKGTRSLRTGVLFILIVLIISLVASMGSVLYRFSHFPCLLPVR